MSLTLEDWRRLYQICDPTERLHVDELDLFVERSDSVAKRIAKTLQAGFDADGKWIICGSVGAGKSTELTKLAQLLEQDFAVVGVDLWRAAARIDEITAAEILLCIGARAVRAAKQSFGHDVDPPLVHNLQVAFRGLLDARSEIDFGELFEGIALFGADLFAPGASTAVSAAAKAAKATDGVWRAKLGGLTRPVKDGDPALDQLLDAVGAVLDDLRAVRPPLVLVDGLDKLTRIESIRDLFATSRILAGPRVPLVYTGPVTLMVSAEWSAAGNYFARERLSNIAVATPAARSRHVRPETVATGRADIHKVIQRRCGHLGKPVDQVFSDESVELIITKSGGLLRQLMMLLRAATKQAGIDERPRIELDLAQRACDILRKEFEITMTAERRTELEFIALEGEPKGGKVSHELLLWNYAIPYANGQLWFAPNPLIELDLGNPTG